MLSFDVGKQRAGASIRAELNIVNDSGGPLSFNVTAGCNCTKVDPKFSIEKSMTGQMRFDVRMPVNPQNVDVGLVCKDESRSILLNVRLLAAVEPDVVAEPKRIRIKSSSEESHTFEIKSNFKSVVVEKAQVLGGFFTTESLRTDNPNVRLTLKHQPQTSPLPTTNLVVMATTADGGELFISIPVEYEDVVRLSPYLVGLRDNGDRYSAILLLAGKAVVSDLSDHGIECTARRIDGGKKSFNIDQFVERKEDVYLLRVSIEKSEFDDWAGDQEVALEVAGSSNGLEWLSKVAVKRLTR